MSITALSTRHYRLFIGGEWVDSASGKSFESINPYDASVNAHVTEAGTEDVDRAVQAAPRAQPGWAATSLGARGRLLWAIAAGLRARREELARLESLDVGKPLRDALGDVDVAAEVLEYWAGAPTKITGDVISVGANMLNYVIREPSGDLQVGRR